MAVLVRASFQMREFEDRFLSLGIPYRVIGGPRFYERAEIRDAMAYLRLIAQGDDDLAFERIVNRPKRGIGDASVQTLHNFARARRIPLSQRRARNRDRRSAAQGAQGAGRLARHDRALERSATRPAHRTRRNGARRVRLHRHAEERQIGGRRAGSTISRSLSARWSSSKSCRLSRTCLAGDGRREDDAEDAST